RSAEEPDQQRAHLPTEAHLFNHYARQGGAVPVGRSGLKKIALLLHAGEFSIALIDDQVHQGIAHVLRGDLAQVLPFVAAFVIAEGDLIGLNLAVERVKFEIFDVFAFDANFLAPFIEHADPITEGSDFMNFTWHENSVNSVALSL